MKTSIKITENQIKELIKVLIKEDIPSAEPSLTSGKDDNVIKIQTFLQKNGFGQYLGSAGIDGVMGKNTKEAIRQFQIKNGKLSQDGIVGSETAKVMGVQPMVNPVKSVSPLKPVVKQSLYILFDGTNFSWIENGKTIRQWKAYSGRTKWNSMTDHQRKMSATLPKSEFMKMKENGPIPSGNYYIGSIQKRTNGDSHKVVDGKDYNYLNKFFSDPKENLKGHDWNSGTVQDLIAWGNYRMPITKLGGTETFGRGSFYVHGGGIAGSVGCIDLVNNIDEFANYFSMWKKKTNNDKINIVVKY